MYKVLGKRKAAYVIQFSISLLLLFVYFMFPQKAFEEKNNAIVTSGPDLQSVTKQEPTVDTSVEPVPQPKSAPVVEFQPTAVDYSKQKVHYKDKVIALIYHHIADKENGITISTQRFQNHLQLLKQHDYNVITMEQYLTFQKGLGQVPQNAILITFDDGYESFYTHAYPELRKFNYPATKFIVVDSVDNPPANKAPRLKWDQMREMERHGMTFYSHTYKHHDHAKVDSTINLKPMLTHPIYLEKEKRIETQDEYRKRIKEDLLYADKRIDEELGARPHLLAFPFGSYNETVLQVGREIGIELFFTIVDGINKPGKDEIYRINAGAQYVTNDILLRKMQKVHKQ